MNEHTDTSTIDYRITSGFVNTSPEETTSNIGSCTSRYPVPAQFPEFHPSSTYKRICTTSRSHTPTASCFVARTNKDPKFRVEGELAMIVVMITEESHLP